MSCSLIPEELFWRHCTRTDVMSDCISACNWRASASGSVCNCEATWFPKIVNSLLFSKEGREETSFSTFTALSNESTNLTIFLRFWGTILSLFLFWFLKIKWVRCEGAGYELKDGSCCEIDGSEWCSSVIVSSSFAVFSGTWQSSSSVTCTNQFYVIILLYII